MSNGETNGHVTDDDFSGSRDVIGQVTIRFPIGYFLLMVLWKGVSISSRSRDIGL